MKESNVNTVIITDGKNEDIPAISLSDGDKEGFVRQNEKYLKWASTQDAKNLIKFSKESTALRKIRDAYDEAELDKNYAADYAAMSFVLNERNKLYFEDLSPEERRDVRRRASELRKKAIDE